MQSGNLGLLNYKIVDTIHLPSLYHGQSRPRAPRDVCKSLGTWSHRRPSHSVRASPPIPHPGGAWPSTADQKNAAWLPHWRCQTPLQMEHRVKRATTSQSRPRNLPYKSSRASTVQKHPAHTRHIRNSLYVLVFFQFVCNQFCVEDKQVVHSMNLQPSLHYFHQFSTSHV